MNIKILALRITAFKGIRKMELALDGHSADLRGRNGTGKTSVYDAYLWMLFGKDSNGAAKFDAKPLNEDGTPRTGTDTEVEALLLVDDRKVKLKRVLHEKWKATPGSATPVYIGDETLCWIDDVPVALEKEYKPYVAGIIGSEDQFRLLSIHGYFMTLPWEQRRRYLVDAAGGDADAEIMARPEFAGMEEILLGKSPEDAKKRLSDQLKRVKAELDVVPERMDELQKMYSPVSDGQLAEIDSQIAAKREELKQVNTQLDGTVDAFAIAAENTRKVQRLNDAIDKRKAELDAPIRKSEREAQEQMERAVNGRDSLAREVSRLGADLSAIGVDIQRLQSEREKLLEEYYKVDDETWKAPDMNTTCPYCGQPLPQEKVQEALRKSETDFNRRKESALSGIENEGKTTATRIERLQSEYAEVQSSLDNKQARLDEMEKTIKDLEAQAAAPKPQHFCYDQDAEYMELMDKLDALRKEMEKPVDSHERDGFLSRRDRLMDEISDLQKARVEWENARNIKNRIRELEKRREELGRDVIEIEGQLSTLTEYTTACCTAMESRINALFHTIKWQLFEPLKNGGYKACCNATLNGVDYSTNLNNGARINAGIEAIRVLSRSLGVTVPCFVDNAEAVNVLEYTRGQMVTLRVSEDKELTLTLEE